MFEETIDLDANTETYTEYGLRLPNGEVRWDSFLGRKLGVPEERSLVVLILRKTAVECGQVEAQFLSGYGWASRLVTVTRGEPTGTYYVLEDPAVAPPLPAPSPESNGNPPAV